MASLSTRNGLGDNTSGAGGRASKRRRRRPPSHFNAVTAAEERFLQQAIQNSKLDRGRAAGSKVEEIPVGPVFFPTKEDFEGNPLDYVEKIRPIAEKYGICKIVPPVGWNPSPYFGVALKSSKKFQTKHQLLHRLQEGISFADGEEYDGEEYLRVATQRTKEWKAAHYPDHDLLQKHFCNSEINDSQKNSGEELEPGQQKPSATSSDSAISTTNKRFTPENLERDYWDIVETHTLEVAVEYGNDVDTSAFGSGFPMSERGRSVANDFKVTHPEKVKLPEPDFDTEDYYKETWWNLNNIPAAPDSVLRHVKVGINGINVPWMYYGSLFTTFCWHNEDNYMYSINYHHKGAPKLWYGCPGTKEAADGLEKVFKSYLSMRMRDVPDLLHHITTMFSPRLLRNADVPVSKILQYEGEYVITFPRSFHGGFSMGPNIGEAVNFASHDWISYGADANERYRSFARPAVFSHDRLTFTMANHLSDQKTHSTCKLLLEELERVVEEELRLRAKLLEQGVRDVSRLITLPKNRLDQLDESSALYDDKRLCHACKHICFFSAVACECSQSKVSCLRHSHYMCRCPTEKKYLMVWSGKDELELTLDRVRKSCEHLKAKAGHGHFVEKEGISIGRGAKLTYDKIAPGAELDRKLHKLDDIRLDILDPNYRPAYLNKTRPLEEGASLESAGSSPVSTIVTSSTQLQAPVLDVSAFAREVDDEVKLVDIQGPKGPVV